MRKHPWLQSLAVTAMAVAASLWLWLGPIRFENEYTYFWLSAAVLPFMVALFARKLAFLWALLPFPITYIANGDVMAMSMMLGIGASWMAAALGILGQRLWKVMNR